METITIDWNMIDNISYQTQLGKSLKNTLRKFDKEALFDEIDSLIMHMIENEENIKEEHRVKSLQNTGITVLQDEAIELNYGDVCIQLIGLNDPDFSERDRLLSESILEAKLSQVNISDGFTILLSHRPEYFNVYQNKNIDLVLSGHAHGGQFRLPFGGGVIAPGQGLFPKYDAGAYTENGTTMIVSRGIGNSIIPVRINNPPEIVIIELNCG